MTPTNHLVPPPELVQQWQYEANHNEAMFPQVATQAAQWGADQELEACIELLEKWGFNTTTTRLRTARRPKPPSLKEQALAALEVIPKLVGFESERDAIRLALEALNA
jgi:hypothetical protein